MSDHLVTDADHLALTRLVTEIAWRIDHDRAGEVWELFVADGTMNMNTSGTPLAGHDALRSWGAARAASGVRTRHLCSGMRFVAEGADRASGTTLITVFMHDGDGLGAAVPSVVGEDRDEFVRTNDGWRFVSRTFTTLFA